MAEQARSQGLRPFPALTALSAHIAVFAILVQAQQTPTDPPPVQTKAMALIAIDSQFASPSPPNLPATVNLGIAPPEIIVLPLPPEKDAPAGIIPGKEPSTDSAYRPGETQNKQLEEELHALPGHAENDADLNAAFAAAVAAQIDACWEKVSTKPRTGTIITMAVSLERDGSLLRAPAFFSISEGIRSSLPGLGPAELAAMKAVENCSPLKLPTALYAHWQTINIDIINGGPAE